VTDRRQPAAKSVALQGFTALEYLLFGTGSDDMAKPGDGTPLPISRVRLPPIST
jgi:predicted lipoprotein